MTVRRGAAVVARVRSDASGRFTVALAPGTYTAQAALDRGDVGILCPAEDLVVPRSTPLTLTCQLLAP